MDKKVWPNIGGDIDAHQRVQELYFKLKYSLSEVMGVKYKELKEFWAKNINY